MLGRAPGALLARGRGLFYLALVDVEIVVHYVLLRGEFDVLVVARHV